MKFYGITEKTKYLIKSYLDNRHQIVRLKGDSINY
jgi:hypothetical protein